MRVLIVDDNAAFADNLAELLEELRCVPRVATRARRALQLAAQEPFEAALVDVHMPDMDGVRLVERLRELAPRARFVLMTAFGQVPAARFEEGDLEAGMPEAALRAQDCGLPLLVKPFEPEAALRVLRACGP